MTQEAQKQINRIEKKWRGNYFQIHIQEHFPEPKDMRISRLKEQPTVSSTANDKRQTHRLFIMKFQDTRRVKEKKKSYKLPGEWEERSLTKCMEWTNIRLLDNKSGD